MAAARARVLEVTHVEEPKLYPATIRVMLAAVETGQSSSKVLAVRLGMTPAAVEQQFCLAMRALNADSRSSAILMALKRGVLRPYRLLREGETGDVG